MNYFELFNLPEEFDVDTQQLKSQYQVLQKMTHPDRFVSASEQERRLYMQKNAQINDAYSVLTSPVARGEHLLTLRGFELADEQQTMGDTAFLMQQMTLREQLADAATESDFDSLDEEIDTLLKDYLAQARDALYANEETANHTAAQTLTKLKFLNKLASEASDKRDNTLDI